MSEWPAEIPADVACNCGLCDFRAETGPEMIEHLLKAHGVDVWAEVDRWPDGAPVVVDLTLEPGDFGG